MGSRTRDEDEIQGPGSDRSPDTTVLLGMELSEPSRRHGSSLMPLVVDPAKITTQKRLLEAALRLHKAHIAHRDLSNDILVVFDAPYTPYHYMINDNRSEAMRIRHARAYLGDFAHGVECAVFPVAVLEAMLSLL